MTSQVSGFQNLPPALLSRLNQIQQALTLLQNRVGYSENGIVNIYNNVTNITNEITEVTEELTQTNQYVTNITNQVTNITNEITEVTEQITYTTENITVVQNEIIEITNNYIDGVELLEDFNLQLDALTLRVTSAEQVIDFLEFNVTRLNNDVADLFRDLNDLEDYIDSEIASHTHNQIVQVNNANTYVIASGNTVETRLNNQSVQEATVSSYKQTLPYTTVQSLNYTPANTAFSTNSMITKKYLNDSLIISSFYINPYQNLTYGIYSNILGFDLWPMRYPLLYTHNPDSSYGQCVTFNSSTQSFVPFANGLYRISYSVTLIIPQTNQDVYNQQAQGDPYSSTAFRSYVTTLFDLTDGAPVMDNRMVTDAVSTNTVSQKGIISHHDSIVAYLQTTSRIRLLTPLMQIKLNPAFTSIYLQYTQDIVSCNITFEYIQK